jgi:hypothetical protein
LQEWFFVLALLWCGIAPNEDSPDPTPAMNSRRVVIAAITFATVIKLCLAIFTLGTNDVITWQSFVANIHQAGDVTVYQLRGISGDPFNHPPFMIHVLRLLDWINRETHLPFPFLIRFPGILADIGTLCLIYRMQQVAILKASITAVVILALCPISVLISGFHGNTDSVMVFFVVASVFMLLVKRSELLAGLAFGMSINIKVVPVILLSAFCLHLKTWRARLTFFGAGAVMVLICSLPYVAQAPLTVIKATLGYSGFAARWGLSNFLYAAGVPSDFVRFGWKLVTIAAVLGLPVWMHRRRADLYTHIAAVFLVFLFLTPSFGVQYLVWPVPFILSLALVEVGLYYGSAGAVLFCLYHYWSGGQWYFAESHRLQPWNAASVIAAFVCWTIVGLALFQYLKMTAKAKHAATS